MPPRQSTVAQDKPFTFKARSGPITIPSSEVYDPSMDAIRELHAATSELKGLDQEESSADDLGMAQMRVSLATEGVIVSGFSSSVAAKIKLSASEVQSFMTAYQQHTGVSIPK